MSKVNFVSEFNLFMRYARDNGLSLRERMLWIALFYVANDRAVYNEQTSEYDWPDDFIQVSNGELNLYCCLDKRAIETLRNQLMQRGLIEFVPGKKNKRNPAYKIHYLSVNVGYKIVPNTPPNYVPNDVPNNDPNDDPNTAPNPSPFSKYNKDSGTGGKIKYIPSDDDEVEVERLRVREVLHNTYKTSFKVNPTLPELNEMERVVMELHLSEIADAAVMETALAAPTNRLAYFKKLCIDWNENYIRTKDDLDTHQTLMALMKAYPDEAVAYGTSLINSRKRRQEKYTRMEAIV